MQEYKYLHSEPEFVGHCPRNGYSIKYAIHGTGPQRILFIHGYGANMGNWKDLIQHFVGEHFSCLLVNNRGIGDHSVGWPTRYTTSGLAEDVAAVLDHCYWKESKSVHLVGTSMGGMIAMELAALIPDRFISLFLISTCRKHKAPGPLRPLVSVFYDLFKELAWPLPIQERVDYELNLIYPNSKFLEMHDSRHPQYKTNRERIAHRLEYMMKNHAITKLGKIGQFFAVGTHNTTDEKLQMIGNSMHVVCVTGTNDTIVDPICTDILGKSIPNSIVHKLPGVGHAPFVEAELKIQELLDECIKTGKQKIK